MDPIVAGLLGAVIGAVALVAGPAPAPAPADDGTLTGILIGAGIALLGSVGSPMLNNWIDFGRDAKREARERVRASVRLLQDSLLGVVWALRKHEPDSDEVERAVRDAFSSAHSLDLGLDVWTTLKFSSVTIKGMTPKEGADELSDRAHAVATAATRLYGLADKPKTHEKELAAYVDIMTQLLAAAGLAFEHGEEDNG